MVMMSSARRTSITSISGVVFISTITSSPSAELALIAMGIYLITLVAFRDVGFGDETHFLDACLLAGQNDVADRLEAHVPGRRGYALPGKRLVRARARSAWRRQILVIIG